MRDIFLMSKGHGCMAQYVILEELGILSSAEIELYCKPGGRLGGHPDYGVPGIAASTGSLGHGLGMAVGMAYADRLKGDDRVVYVALGDGEMQEGSTWEAMMMAANLQPRQSRRHGRCQRLPGARAHQRDSSVLLSGAGQGDAFGWESVEVDGHDHAAIYEAVVNRRGERPMLLVCRTVKGKGVSYMENVPIWHYRSPDHGGIPAGDPGIGGDRAVRNTFRRNLLPAWQGGCSGSAWWWPTFRRPAPSTSSAPSSRIASSIRAWPSRS